MDSIRRLEEIFARFPGIGPRQARRFVYHLLNKSPSAIKEFTGLVEEVRKSVSECSMCHRFYVRNASKAEICSVCGDPSRDRTVLMVVARDSDFEIVEKSGVYKGLYFVLGGIVPVLEKEPEKKIRLAGLLTRIKNDKQKEVILSLNATPDGENTTELLQREIMGPKVTILGRGLSTGAELEYVDTDTIKNALLNRH